MLKADGSAVWSCRRGGKTKAWAKAQAPSLAYEYRSPTLSRRQGGVVHLSEQSKEPKKRDLYRPYGDQPSSD